MKTKLKRLLKIIGGYLVTVVVTAGSLAYIVVAVEIFATLNKHAGWGAIGLFIVGIIDIAMFVGIVHIIGRTAVLGIRANEFADSVDTTMEVEVRHHDKT